MINGKEISIKKLLKQSKHILLDFGATWCGGCRKQEATIKELYKSNKVNVVGLFPDDKKENVLSYVSKRNINWPVGLLSKKMKSKLRVNAYPTYMLISKEGKIIQIDMNSEHIKSYVSQL